MQKLLQGRRGIPPATFVPACVPLRQCIGVWTRMYVYVLVQKKKSGLWGMEECCGGKDGSRVGWAMATGFRW